MKGGEEKGGEEIGGKEKGGEEKGRERRKREEGEDRTWKRQENKDRGVEWKTKLHDDVTHY